MYCIKQLSPPTVSRLACWLQVEGGVDRSQRHQLLVLARGASIVFKLMPQGFSISTGDSDAELCGRFDEKWKDDVEGDISFLSAIPGSPHTSTTTSTGDIVSVYVGGTPLEMLACADQSILFVLTDDNVVLLLRVRVDSSQQRCEASYLSISVSLVMQTRVPLDYVVNHPPTVESNAPVAASSPDGSMVVFQTYRGWMHVLSITKAAAGLPLPQYFSAVQLDKAVLRSVTFIPSTASDSSASFCLVPIFDRGLPSARAYFVTRSEHAATPTSVLVDAARRWQLSGTPYRCWGLSAGSEGLSSSSSATPMVFAMLTSQRAHALVYILSPSTKIAQRLPNEVVEGVEVVTDSGSAKQQSTLWLLTVQGDLLCSSLRAAQEHSTSGDCDDMSVQRVTVRNMPPRVRTICFLRAAPCEAGNLLLCGDGVNVVLIDPVLQAVVAAVVSSGPTVGMCDGPRGSLISLSSSGVVTTRRALINVDVCAEVPVGPATSLFAWLRGGGDDGTTVCVLLVSDGQTNTTRCFLLDIGHESFEEVAAGDVRPSFVPPFASTEATIAATSMSTPALRVAVQVTPSNIYWSWTNIDGTRGQRVVAAADDMGIAWRGTTLHAAAFPPASMHAHVVAAVGPTVVWNALLDDRGTCASATLATYATEVSCIAVLADIEVVSVDVGSSQQRQFRVTVATAQWNDFTVRIDAFYISGENAAFISSPCTSQQCFALPSLVRSMTVATARCDPDVTLWLTDSLGSCYRATVVVDVSSAPVAISAPCAPELVVDKAALPCLIAPVQTGGHFVDSNSCSSKSAPSSTVAIFTGSEVEAFMDIPSGGSQYIRAVSRYACLPAGDVADCGVALDSWWTRGEMVLVVARRESLFVLSAPSTASYAAETSGPRAKELATHWRTVQQKHLFPHTSSADTPLGLTALTQDTCVVITDTKRSSALCLLDTHTLATRDSLFLDEHEFAVGAAERVPNVGDAVILATGLCGVIGAPADPCTGRVLLVGCAPLEIRAQYVMQEPIYCFSVFTAGAQCAGSLYARSDVMAGERSSDPQLASTDASCIDVFVAVGCTSSVTVLRMVGRNFVPIASTTTSNPVTNVCVSFPYISVSQYAWGTVYYEFAIESCLGAAPAAAASRGGDSSRLPSDSVKSALDVTSDASAMSYRLVKRCVEPFASTTFAMEQSFSCKRFVRGCLRRNLHLVALASQSAEGKPGGASAPSDTIESNGGSGMTTSPVVPVSISTMRLSGRALCCAVSSASHAAITFLTNPAMEVKRPEAHPHGTTAIHIFNFNSQFEPDFTIAATTPKMFIPCDDGSLYFACGIPSELSRLLTRVEQRLIDLSHAQKLLRPEGSPPATAPFGVAPGTVSYDAANLLDEWTLSVPLDSGVRAAGSCDLSIVSFEAARATHTMVRTAASRGFLDRSVTDQLLTLSSAAQSAIVDCAVMQEESSDTVTVTKVCDVLRALCLLE